MMEVLKVVAYSNALEILGYLYDEGPSRFTDIENDLKLNPNIVNMRLKDFGLVDLVQQTEDGRYTLTEKGKKAREAGQKLVEI